MRKITTNSDIRERFTYLRRGIHQIKVRHHL